MAILSEYAKIKSKLTALVSLGLQEGLPEPIATRQPSLLEEH
jgi:hypothetical protein